MKTQLASFLRWLLSLLYGVLSDPMRIRLIVTCVVVCLFIAALLIPALTATADGLSGGGSHSR